MSSEDSIIANARQEFSQLIRQVTGQIHGRALDAELQSHLNQWAAPASPLFNQIRDACQLGIEQGWMCKYEGGGLRYGRVIKPGPELDGFSVDVVDMKDIAGPHHRHPNGEIDLIMPIGGEAEFDGQPAGWKVYEPGSAHCPTVSKGRALVLYLLPGGAIEFTKSPADARA